MALCEAPFNLEESKADGVGGGGAAGASEPPRVLNC